MEVVQEEQQYLVAYPPIPRCVIKEEPQSDDDETEGNEEMKHLIAYPPLPQVDIKEEMEIEEGRDEFISDREQLMTQQGRHREKENEESTAQTGSATFPFVESPAADQVNYIGSPRAKKRKVTVKDVPLSAGNPHTTASGSAYLEGGQSAVKMSSSRILYSKGRSTRIVHGGVKIKRRIDTEELKDTGSKGQQKVSKHDDADLSTSYSSDDDPTPIQSTTGPSNAIRKTVGKLPSKAYHLNGKESSFECKNCGRCFKEASYLKTHLARTCEIEPQFKCEECGHQFKRKYNLRRHLVDIHHVETSRFSTFGAGPKIRPEYPFKCDKCSKTYKHKGTLSRHLMFECQLDPSFLCTVCDYRAALRENLKKHLMIVHNVDPSQLSAFGAAGRSKSRPDLPFKCGKCERSYKNKASLSKHWQYECGVDRSFQCTHCDYRASQKSNLTSHIIHVHGHTASQSSQQHN